MIATVSLALAGCSVESPMASQGKLDLSRWDFATDSQVRLDGGWLFQSDGFQDGNLLQKSLPGRWELTEPVFPIEGMGSYHLQVALPRSQTLWSLRVPEFSSASQVWVDGRLVLESGRVGSGPEKEVPRVQIRQVTFLAERAEVSLVVQISNYHDRIGATQDSIFFGPAESMQPAWELEKATSAFLFGSLLVMGLLNLFVFYSEGHRRGNLWLSLFAFSVAIRNLITGPSLPQDLFPSWDFQAVTSIKFLSAMGAISCFLLYMKQLMPKWWPSPMFVGFLLYTLLFALLCLALPVKLFSQAFALLYTLPLAAVMLVAFGLFVVAAFRAEQEVRAVLPAIVLVLLGGLNDNLNVLVPTPWGLILPQCMFLFMLYNSWLVTRQMQQTFLLSQRLSSDLQKLDALKDDFLARVTHELRTPLHGMIGILDAFRQGDYGPLAERQNYHLTLVESSSKRLLTMVNSILDFSQLKHGTVGELRPVFYKELVDLLLPVFAGQVQRGVSVVNRVSVHLPAALGDATKVEQVVQHLLANAIQHTSSGTIAVEGELRDQKIWLSVRDTGSGIPADELPHLFSPFRQDANADTRSKNGLGLGLAISHQLIQQLGGSLSAESQLGVGTVVAFCLPICPPDQLQAFTAQKKDREIRRDTLASRLEPLPDAAKVSAPAATEVEQLTVLIVDDEPVNLMVLESFLRRLNYRVLQAFSGPAALELADLHTIDLVILDIMMPGMSGYEVSRRLRQKFSAASLPIILLTAKNQMEDLIQGFAAGASDYLTKPFVRAELRARMEFHLTISRAAREGAQPANKS